MSANSIEYRVRFPSDGSTDTDLFNVDPVRDAFKRFASGAKLPVIDSDGTKLDDYPYGERVEAQVSEDAGATWATRFAGIALTPTRDNRKGLPRLDVDVVGYTHLLARTEGIVKDYSSTAISTILNDLITTFTSVNWVAGNVDVQNDDSIDFSVRGETVAEAVDRLASISADEEWFVNQSFEFVFQQQDASRAAPITDTDVIAYDLPQKGKRAVNQVKLYYGASLSDVVTVNDREAQQSLKNKLNAPRRVIISETDSRSDISTRDAAENLARKKLGEQTVIQTGTITVPLGRFDTESGDIVNIDISDAGISNTDFRVAQIDDYWQRGVHELTVAENSGGSIDELLIALSDSLINERLKNADPAATETEFLDIRSGVEFNVTSTLTTKTRRDGFVLGQSETGTNTSDTLGAGVAGSATHATNTTKVTVPLLNLARDVWSGGNSAWRDHTHLAVGEDGADATKADTSLGVETDRVELDKFGLGNQSDQFEWLATVPAGGVFAPVDHQEFGLADADSGGNVSARSTTPAISTNATTRLKVHQVATIDDDADEQGVITNKGQERLRDLLLGESGHEPDQFVYGNGTATAVVTNTSLQNVLHADAIDSTADRSPGLVVLTEEASGVDTETWSEVGQNNSAGELESRVTFEPLESNVTLVTNHGFIATNE